MDNGTPKRAIIIDPANLPVNMRESDDPKIREQYTPFNQLMKNLARQKSDSSSLESEEEQKEQNSPRTKNRG